MTEETYLRTYDLSDIQILRAADGYGDGRTVEAYATVFDTPAEITDGQGHYMEVIARTAFNRTLAHGIDRVGVFYHHALTMHGTPATGVNSVPIGSPVEITADGTGLRTVTRYNGSDFADHILEAIRNGDIKGYSFRGKIYKSSPAKVPRIARGGGLPTITRTELGLIEYGPTPTPAYQNAGIIAMRALSEINDKLTALGSTINPSATPETDPDDVTATPDPGPGGTDPREHSEALRRLQFRSKVRERGL